MKKILAILGILILLFIGYIWFFYFRGKKNVHEGPKPVPMAVGKHSQAFNQNVDSILIAYYAMTEGFVNWDTTVVNKNAAAVKMALENFRLDELQNDTAKDAQAIYATSLDFLANSKNEATNIYQNPLIDKKREGLNSLTDNLRNLLVTIHFDGQKIYYLESPTAFNEAYPGYWLSPKEEIRNPYFGNKDPKHKDEMLGNGNSKGLVVK